MKTDDIDLLHWDKSTGQLYFVNDPISLIVIPIQMQQFNVQNTFQMETRITKKNSKQPPLHNISIHSGRRRIRRRKLLSHHPKALTKKLQCIFLLKPLHLYRYFIWPRLRWFSIFSSPYFYHISFWYFIFSAPSQNKHWCKETRATGTISCSS